MVTTSRTEEREGDGDAPPLELGATTRRWDAWRTYSNGAGAAAPAHTQAINQSIDRPPHAQPGVLTSNEENTIHFSIAHGTLLSQNTGQGKTREVATSTHPAWRRPAARRRGPCAFAAACTRAGTGTTPPGRPRPAVASPPACGGPHSPTHTHRDTRIHTYTYTSRHEQHARAHM
jgi:hypothetical protein